jgi:hypothetical protein
MVQDSMGHSKGRDGDGVNPAKELRPGLLGMTWIRHGM